MVESSDVSEIKPPARLYSFFNRKPPTLWYSGEPRLLTGKLLGIMSARQIDSDLASKSSQLLKQLATLQETAFIGGWHSPLEKEALRFLLTSQAPMVFCVAKSLNRFIPSVEVRDRLDRGRALLLTHCSAKAKRISRDASVRRNQLAVGLADALLVLSAPEGSASLKLAKSASRRGKPVLTPEHPMNMELLATGALSATLENIQRALWPKKPRSNHDHVIK